MTDTQTSTNGRQFAPGVTHARNASELVDRIERTVSETGTDTAAAERDQVADDIRPDSPEAILRLHLPTNHTYFQRVGDNRTVVKLLSALGAKVPCGVSAATATPEGLWYIVVTECVTGCPGGDGYNATIQGPGCKWEREHVQMSEVIDAARLFGLIR